MPMLTVPDAMLFCRNPGSAFGFSPNATSPKASFAPVASAQFVCANCTFFFAAKSVTFPFRNGKVTDFAAKKNVQFAQTNWAEATGAKDAFGEVAFGLNPKALPGFLQNSIVSGTVSIGIGDNRDAGGKNDSSYGFAAPLAHANVEIGGKTVIQDGAWTI